MSMKEQILSIAMQDPRFQETITVIERQLSGTNIVAEDLTEAIQMLEYVLQNPEVYPEVRMAAIKDGLIDEGMFPPQFDEVLIISLLVVLYGMQDRLAQQGYARGGLAVSGKQLARMGQGGDRQLAHINDREAEVLRRMGGQGTVNPNTGLREYKGLKNIIKTALPIALSVVAPGLGTAIGTAIGLSGTAASIAGGAILGGGTSFLTGGDPILGAVTGGLGGFAPVIGEGISAIAPGLDPSIVTGLSGGVTGALGQTLAGGDPLTGFATGAIGSMLRPELTNMTRRAGEVVVDSMKSGMPAITTESGAPIQETVRPTYDASDLVSDMDAVSFNPEPVTENPLALKPLAENLYEPPGSVPSPTANVDMTELAAKDMARRVSNNPMLGADFATDISALQTQDAFVPEAGRGMDFSEDIEKLGQVSQPQQGEGFATLRNMLPEPIANLLPDDLSMTELGLGALGLAALSGLSKQDQLDISMAETNGIFDKTTNQYDFVKIRGEANQRGMTLGQFLSSPFFINDQSKYYMNNDTMYAAEGGIMDAPGYVSGPGDGRDDVINARLSDGEYVIDAESVSMLGDGSNAAGAKMLDDMRKKLRMHKGKVLAKGRFSPDAKSPLEYMRRSA